MLYFAYGSNLDWLQMKRRCKDSEFVCRALLKDFCVAFTHRSNDWSGGVADIVPGSGREVWGVVYDISADDLTALDSYEGYEGPGRNNLYNRIKVTVLKEGNPYDLLPDIWSYQVAFPSRDHIPPSARYLNRILEGAEYWGLPEGYRAGLRRHF